MTFASLYVIFVGIGMIGQWSFFLATRQVYPVSVGMLLYTSVVSPGYFAQKRAWPMVAMFAVLLVLALVSLGLVLRS